MKAAQLKMQHVCYQAEGTGLHCFLLLDVLMAELNNDNAACLFNRFANAVLMVFYQPEAICIGRV